MEQLQETNEKSSETIHSDLPRSLYNNYMVTCTILLKIEFIAYSKLENGVLICI